MGGASRASSSLTRSRNRAISWSLAVGSVVTSGGCGGGALLLMVLPTVLCACMCCPLFYKISDTSKYYDKDHDKLRFNTDDTHFLLHSRIESGTVDLKAAAALTAIMEYLAAEILEVAGNEARQEAGVTQLLATLEPHHVQTAIRRDAELASVFSPKEACEAAA